jgi:hypothetical protein
LARKLFSFTYIDLLGRWVPEVHNVSAAAELAQQEALFGGRLDEPKAGPESTLPNDHGAQA